MLNFSRGNPNRTMHDSFEFQCSAEPEVLTLLRGGPGRLRQVILNLTGNALKFSHQGEVSVRARLVSEKNTQVIVRFSVRDSGIGIPADRLDLLFQHFTQVDASATRKFRGTG